MYSGEVHVPTSMVDSFMKLAAGLEVHGLKSLQLADTFNEPATPRKRARKSLAPNPDFQPNSLSGSSVVQQQNVRIMNI
jgi:hypothetical protein